MEQVTEGGKKHKAGEGDSPSKDMDETTAIERGECDTQSTREDMELEEINLQGIVDACQRQDLQCIPSEHIQRV